MATDTQRTLGLISVCAPVYNEEVLVEEFYARDHGGAGRASTTS